MVEAWLAFALVLLSAFFAGAETGAYCLNRLQLRLRSDVGDRGALRLDSMLSDRQRFVATMLGGTNLAHYGASAFATAFFHALGTPHPDLVATACVSPLLLVIGEIFPKALFAAHADSLMYRLASPLRAAEVLLWPLATLLKAIMAAFNLILGREETEGLDILTTARLRYFLDEGQRSGAISDEQGRIARNILEFKQIPLGKVMVPLELVEMMPLQTTPAELRQRAATTSYARLPIYDRERTNIVGILVLLEFLTAEPEPEAIAGHLRPPVRLSASLPIDEALLQMQRARQPMVVVVDEEGRAVGVATMKDLLEEVVGELREW